MTGTVKPITNPSRLSAHATRLYRDAGMLSRWLMRLRPLICPFEELMIHVPSGSRVLDVGCGAGLFLALLSAEGQEMSAVGFDSNSGAIAQARVMASALPDGAAALTFEHRRVEEPWPAGEFDVVAMIDVMHHIPPPAQREVFHEAMKHVAPGGILLYKDMCRRPRWRAGMNRLHDLIVARHWIHYLPIEQVDAWARDAGMQTERAETINRLWYGHELRVLRRRQ